MSTPNFSIVNGNGIIIKNDGSVSEPTLTISLDDSGVTAGSKGDTSNKTPGFGETFKVPSGTVDSTGRLTVVGDHTVKIPNATATTSSPGLMSADDKQQLNRLADGIAPPVTIVGNPVASFTADVAGRTLNPLLVNIEPVQADGTLVDGEVQPPSPTNVRAITGWTGVKIARTNSPTLITITPTQAGTGDPSPTNIRSITGVSLPEAGTVYGGTLDVAKGILTVDYQQMLITHLDGLYLNADENSVGGWIIISGMTMSARTNGYCDKLPSVYTPVDVAIGCCFGANNSRFYVVLPQSVVGGSTLQALNDWLSTNELNIIYPLATPVTYSLTPAQVETALSALGYSGNAWPVTFPSDAGTVYGGTLDVAKGILMVTHGFITISGGFYEYANHLADCIAGYYPTVSNMARNSRSNGFCDCLPPTYHVQDVELGISFGIGNSSRIYVVFPKSIVGETIESLNGYLSEHNIHAVYPLANPVTYSLTPTQVTTLLGTNNVWADCGAVTVTYPYGTKAPIITSDNLDAFGSAVSWETYKEKELANDNNYAAINHNHSASNITSGILDTTWGGTGNSSGCIRVGQKSGTTIGEQATCEGLFTTASGAHSHAEGYETTASGGDSHAEGYETTASGGDSHAEGYYTKASGRHSHAEGSDTTASGSGAHAEGYGTTASGDHSHASGVYTIASAGTQTAIGNYNVAQTDTTKGWFIVGKGTSSARANAFRVGSTESWAAGTMNASGADYAELFEWEDGNPNNEDRRGLFVTIVGDKIRLASDTDDFILGIISGNPTVLGDVYDDQWKGMYEYDVFGTPIYEDVEIPDKTIKETDKDGNEVERVIIPAHTKHCQKLNSNYDSNQVYIPRTDRPEWSPVGLVGKLVAIDDGTCQENGWATAGSGGVATNSEIQTKFRVMKRIDDNHINILILP